MRNLYTWRVSSFLKFSFTTRLLRFMKDEWMFQNEKMVTGRSMILSPSESIIEAWLDEPCGSKDTFFLLHHEFSYIRSHFIRSDRFFSPFQFSYFIFSCVQSSASISQQNHITSKLHENTFQKFETWIKTIRNESQFNDHLLRVTANLSNIIQFQCLTKEKKNK